MPSITLKNIPDDLYETLKREAELNRRSINREILVALEKALRSTRVDPTTFLRRARRLRDSLDVPALTDEFLDEARRGDRE